MSPDGDDEGHVRGPIPRNPMLDAEPPTFFAHCWANDDAVTLARALRRALDKLQRVKG